MTYRLPRCRTVFLFLTPLVSLLGIGIFLTDIWISESTASQHTADRGSVPEREVALVLGCSEYLSNGRLNLYFQHRINAAAELYHAGKCDYLLVSGDNGKKTYNEPDTMRRALLNRGVPDERIISDHAGFRTLDSVVRAKEVFQQDSLLVVSQEFHNERAIFIGKHHGIDVSGFNAENVSTSKHIRTWFREKLARVKTALDLFVTKAEPRYFGEPVFITNPS